MNETGNDGIHTLPSTPTKTSPFAHQDGVFDLYIAHSFVSYHWDIYMHVLTTDRQKKEKEMR